MLKISKLFQIRWGLHKKFKNCLLQVCILNFQIYKSILFEKSLILLTKLGVFSTTLIKSDYIVCSILKYKKKKFSVLITENYKKFILNINLKARNIVI